MNPPSWANSVPSFTTSSGAASVAASPSGHHAAPLTVASKAVLSTANGSTCSLTPGAVEPVRRAVARELDHRLVSERAGRPQRIARVRHGLAVTVVVLDLDQVLHAVDLGLLQPQ